MFNGHSDMYIKLKMSDSLAEQDTLFTLDYALKYVILCLQLLHHWVTDLAEKYIFEDGPSFIRLKDEICLVQN